MGSVSSMAGAGFATNLIYDGAAGFFDANQQRMALANRVTGNETPEELIAINNQDKQLAFQGIRDKINYEIGNAMEEANERRRQKDREQRQRLFQMGAIFA